MFVLLLIIGVQSYFSNYEEAEFVFKISDENTFIYKNNLERQMCLSFGTENIKILSNGRSCIQVDPKYFKDIGRQKWSENLIRNGLWTQAFGIYFDYECSTNSKYLLVYYDSGFWYYIKRIFSKKHSCQI